MGLQGFGGVATPQTPPPPPPPPRSASALAPTAIPSTSTVIQIPERDGARLTRDTQFGCDLLENHPHLQELCERDFSCLYCDPGTVFEDVLHGNGQLFRNSLSYFTYTITHLIMELFVILYSSHKEVLITYTITHLIMELFVILYSSHMERFSLLIP